MNADGDKEELVDVFGEDVARIVEVIGVSRCRRSELTRYDRNAQTIRPYQASRGRMNKSEQHLRSPKRLIWSSLQS
jgi:hypothetical protein